MPDLVIRIKKKTDGTAALSCVRADGTTTWQRQEGQPGRFFPRHDLTHYAVETVLGYRRAFYGLVAAGWSMSDFGTPWPRGPLPDEGHIAEMVVGFLDVERATGERGGAGALNASIAQMSADRGIAPVPPLSDGDLERMRAMRGELFARWEAVEQGGTLEVVFHPPLSLR
ncbi:MAG: hypothetical protein NVS9B3_11480 [Gemmatimonadaceae bacterium]